MQCTQTNPKTSLKEDLESIQGVSMANTGMRWMKNEVRDTKAVKINSCHCLYRNGFIKKYIKIFINTIKYPN